MTIPCGLVTRIALFLSVLSCGGSALAQCPAWQEGFHVPGTNSAVEAFADFVDGSGQRVLLLGGYRLQTTGTPLLGNPLLSWDGTSLTPFAALNQETRITDLIVWDNGTGPALYASGQLDGSSLMSVGRWNGTSFETLGGGMSGLPHDLEVFDDGTGPALYAAGEFTMAGGFPARHVARWNGTAWSALGNGTTQGPNDDVFALTGWDDGSGPALYAAGRFSGIGGTPASRIAKWDGTSWSPVGPGLAAGQIFTLETFDDGTGSALYAGGSFATTGAGTVIRALARWDGATWSTVGGGLGGSTITVNALAVGDVGSGSQLYATGVFTTADGNVVNGSASWDGNSWQPLGAGTSGVALGFHDDGTGPALYVGGTFNVAGDVAANGVARWNGTTWSAIHDGDGINGRVYALAEHDDGTGNALYAAGFFQTAGSTPVRNLARFDGSAWSALGTGANWWPYALKSHDDGSGPALYVGGGFSEIGGVTTRGIARWNGSAWSDVGGGIANNDGHVFALAEWDDGTGNALYAAGYFTQIGGVTAYDIARWNGSNWSALGGGMNNSIWALAVHDDGSGPALYAGGEFTMVGGVPMSRVARWNGSTWSPLGAGIGGGFEPRVLALHSFDDGAGARLYVGGEFTSPFSGITSWNGSTFEPLGTGVASGYEVRAFASFDEGLGQGPRLFAGGRFGTIGGVQSPNISRWNGTSWSSLAGGSGDVQALQVHDDGQGGGAKLFLGGGLQHAGTTFSHGVAAWSSCGETGRTLCFGDGSGTACPCGNASTPGDRDGCTNSTGFAGRLRASGAPSLANDTLLLSGSRMTNGSALYFQGTARVNGGNGAVFGDGLRCAAGTIVRLAIVSNASGASQYPRAGDAPIATQGAVAQPGVRVYQVWFRDAASFCTPDTFALTNAVEIVWGA